MRSLRASLRQSSTCIKPYKLTRGKPENLKRKLLILKDMQVPRLVILRGITVKLSIRIRRRQKFIYCGQRVNDQHANL